MNILIRDEFPDQLADDLKRHFRINTASKAVLRACMNFLPHVDRVGQLEREIADLHMVIKRQQQVIEGARSAAALLLERTGQGDLISDAAQLEHLQEPFSLRSDIK